MQKKVKIKKETNFKEKLLKIMLIVWLTLDVFCMLTFGAKNSSVLFLCTTQLLTIMGLIIYIYFKRKFYFLILSGISFLGVIVSSILYF